MSPKSEGVQGARVLHLAARLKVGCRVGQGEAPCAHEQHARGLGLLRLGVLEEDSAVVTGGGYMVDMAVVDLQYQVLDV